MFVVDRIENGYAVVEFGGTFIDVPLNCFNEEIHDGDVLTFIVNKVETENLKSINENKLCKLFSKHESKAIKHEEK